MNLNDLLLWFVSVSCISILLRASRSLTDRNRGWAGLSGLLLGITALAFYRIPSQAGLIGGSIWFVLILLPMVGNRWVNGLIYQERYGAASRLAGVLGWLHPMDGWREYPKLLSAIALAQRGKLEEGIALLQRYQSSSTSMGQLATVFCYRLEGRWEDLLAWVQHHRLTTVAGVDQGLMMYYLRSLGETGNLNGLLQGINHYSPYLERTGQRDLLQLSRLLALAFCGQSHRVQQVLQQSPYSMAMREFWLATAEMAAGERETATQRLLTLRGGADPILQAAIDYRLSHPLTWNQNGLSYAARQLLDQIELNSSQERRYGHPFTFVSNRSYATYSLIALNVLMFIGEERLGGSENLETLYQLGALSPPAVWQGEWWRLLAANFLHFGWIHLGMNMGGLFFLGGFVEAMLGRIRYLFIYFSSGIGAMLTITLLTITFHQPAQILVGASAAIMGLVGAIAALMMYGWWREKSRIAARNLRLLLLVVGMQIFFDLSTPNVSFMGHTLGLIGGFGITSLLLFHRQLQGKTTSLS